MTNAIPFRKFSNRIVNRLERFIERNETKRNK